MQISRGTLKQNLRRERAGKMTFEEGLRLVQSEFMDPEVLGEEEAARNRRAAEDAMAGVPGSRETVISLLVSFLSDRGIEIKEMDMQLAAYEIYRELWGLGPLEEIYCDPEVNEIQVNAPDRVYVLKNLRLEYVPGVRFRDDDHVMNLIARLVMHDRGVALNRSNPTVESMRKDGTRITATCPPVSEHVTCTLRKHLRRVVSFEEMISRGVLDEKGRDLLRLLVKGRANIAVIGGVGSGKTTLVRTLCGEFDRRARIVVLETDRELQLARNYPDRNVIELEEHAEIGRTLKSIFRVVLRYSPTVIIVGEFRGEGEASEAVQACERGHDGSITTAHFNSARLFVSGTARMLLREGLNLPRDAAEEMVASAFNVVVKMFGDSTRGVMKLEAITELIPGTPVIYRDLLRWVPSGSDYLEGNWQLVERPSEELILRLNKYGVSREMLEEVYRRCS
ncbi:pilus assembly protein CpaF [Thermanaeromonas toyohensis ToBE]|uniref:Pilus assembly protein CpaF n=1 Tax=Thermanaeromonas toyohensis ToBE TaxID=698762 RepID=A0A1W1VT17_9FIRM|nr:ATPase, T2SS/T4P/T4SS family [Thermanaeromonas toyohensis]SMB96512.1 pilus assembly protein CpaF [Thermanaeromonas toyohensis ToBE]